MSDNGPVTSTSTTTNTDYIKLFDQHKWSILLAIVVLVLAYMWYNNNFLITIIDNYFSYLLLYLSNAHIGNTFL